MGITTEVSSAKLPRAINSFPSSSHLVLHHHERNETTGCSNGSTTLRWTSTDYLTHQQNNEHQSSSLEKPLVICLPAVGLV